MCHWEKLDFLTFSFLYSRNDSNILVTKPDGNQNILWILDRRLGDAIQTQIACRTETYTWLHVALLRYGYM